MLFTWGLRPRLYAGRPLRGLRAKTQNEIDAAASISFVVKRLWCLMDDDVTQTSRLSLPHCRSARVEKRPGQGGPGENFALCNSSSKPENVFQAQRGGRPH